MTHEQWRAVAYDSPGPDTNGDIDYGTWHDSQEMAELELLERAGDEPPWEGYCLERRVARYGEPEREEPSPAFQIARAAVDEQGGADSRTVPSVSGAKQGRVPPGTVV